MRVIAAVLVAGTAASAAALVWSAASPAPGWLIPALVVATLLAAGLRLASLAQLGRSNLLSGAGLSAAAVALVLVPGACTLDLAARHLGAFDTPFQSATLDDRQRLALTDIAAELAAIGEVRAGSTDLLAVQSAYKAAPVAYLSGQEVLPIGGLTGTQPTPSTPALRTDIAHGLFRLVLTFRTPGPRLTQVLARCRPSFIVPQMRDFVCAPADA